MAAALGGGRAAIDGVIFHTDHGSTCTATSFTTLCRNLGVSASTTRAKRTPALSADAIRRLLPVTRRIRFQRNHGPFDEWLDDTPARGGPSAPVNVGAMIDALDQRQ